MILSIVIHSLISSDFVGNVCFILYLLSKKLIEYKVVRTVERPERGGGGGPYRLSKLETEAKGPHGRDPSLAGSLGSYP